MNISIVALLHTLTMTTAVPQCFPGFILRNKRMRQKLVCRWSKALVTGDKAKSNYFQMHEHIVSRFNGKLQNEQMIVPCQTDLNKVLCLVGELPWQQGHFPSLCPNVEQGGHLIHMCQRWFPSGHLKHRAAHAPDV